MYSYDESNYDSHYTWYDEYYDECERLGYDPEEEFEDEDEWEEAREEYLERMRSYRITRTIRR